MGNETSFPSLVKTSSNDKSVLQSQLQWSIAQTARVNFSQSLINQAIHAPLIVPSIQQAISRSNNQSMNSLYNHLTYSIDLLCSNIDDLLNNKEISQRGLQPKEARINGYHITNDFVQQSNHQSLSSATGQRITSLGLSNQGFDEPISFSEFLVDDSEESLVDRALIGSRFVLLQSVNQSLNQALMYAVTLAEQKGYLSKRFSISQDYYEDHVFSSIQAVDQALNQLLPVLTTTRMAFVMLYRDFQLQSFKQIISEWIRVLTGLQSTWARGPCYKGPYQTVNPSQHQTVDPVIDTLLTKIGDKQQLIGISLTSPNQTHLAPNTAPPRPSNSRSSFDPASFLDQLISQLHSKARVLDMAVRHNEIEAVDAAVGTIANQNLNCAKILIPDDRLFVMPPSDIKRAHRRVVSQLALNRRHVINASEAKMAVNNMRNRLTTLTHAMIQLADTKGNRSPQPSEQLDKISAEAHNEVCGLRSMFDLFMPQVVLELTKTLGAASDQIVQQQLNHLKSNLISMTPYARSMLTLSPPPVPQRASRPSLSVKLANETHSAQSIEVLPVKAQTPAADCDDVCTTASNSVCSARSSTSDIHSSGSVTPKSNDSPPSSAPSTIWSPPSQTSYPSVDHSAEINAIYSPYASDTPSSYPVASYSPDGDSVRQNVPGVVLSASSQQVPAITSPQENTVSKPEARHRRSPSFGLLAQETYGVDLTKVEEHVPRDTPEFEISVHNQLDSLRPVGIKLTDPDSKEFWWKKVFVEEHLGEPSACGESPTNVDNLQVITQSDPLNAHTQGPVRILPPPIPAKPSRAVIPSTTQDVIPNSEHSPVYPVVNPIRQSGSDPALNKQLSNQEPKEKSSSLRRSRRRASETSQPVFTSTLASLLPPRRLDAGLDQPHSPGSVNLKTEEMSPISANSSSVPLRTSPNNSPPSGLRSIIKKGGSPDGRRRGNVTFAPDVRTTHHMSSFERYNLQHGGHTSMYSYGSDDDSTRLKTRGMSQVSSKYLREGDVLKRASVSTGPSNHNFNQEAHYI